MPDSLLLAAGLVSASVAFLVLVWRHGRAAAEDWQERWPPLTEAEFLAKCAPGVNPRTALTVRRIVSMHLGLPYE